MLPVLDLKTPLILVLCLRILTEDLPLWAEISGWLHNAVLFLMFLELHSNYLHQCCVAAMAVFLVMTWSSRSVMLLVHGVNLTRVNIPYSICILAFLLK